MSPRRQRSIPLGGRYRQVSLYEFIYPFPNFCCATVHTLRPRQNGRHFAYDIFKRIFLNENMWIPLKISLKFVPKVRINNIPVLVQIMAWRLSGDKPLSALMMGNSLTHICVTRPQWVKVWKRMSNFISHVTGLLLHIHAGIIAIPC